MDEKEKTGISRRDFVRLASAGPAAVAVTGALSPLTAQAQGEAPITPARWDLEADVVVIGSGASGAGEAIRKLACTRSAWSIRPEVPEASALRAASDSASNRLDSVLSSWAPSTRMPLTNSVGVPATCSDAASSRSAPT